MYPEEPATLVLKDCAHILAALLQSSISSSREPSEPGLSEPVKLTWWVSSVPSCLPNPHTVWPQGSGGGRSEGQGIFLPGYFRRLNPPGPAAPPPTWGVLSLHATLLRGFCPGSVPLPTSGNGKATPLGPARHLGSPGPHPHLNVFLSMPTVS